MTKLPTFLVIGVEKAGTTSIYTYLNQHPQIYMSPVKETNFLEKDWSTVDSQTIKRSPDKRIDTFEKYCQLFENAGDAIARGEVSPNYLFHYQTSSQQIQKYVPDAQFIAILRDPVERAFSDYLMHLRDAINVGNVASLGEQVKTKATTSFTLRKGLYYQPIKHFVDTFGRDRVKILLYDQLAKDAPGLMREFYRFVGVDGSFTPDTSTRAQVAQVPKNQSFNNLLKTKNPVRAAAASMLKPLLSDGVRQRIRTGLIQMNSQGKETVQLTAEERQLLNEYYAEDVKQLQDLIQMDLSHWLKPAVVKV